MPDNERLRKGRKEQFIQELTASEKVFFLKKAQEAITRKGYRTGEDLYHYCYFLTLKERMTRFGSYAGEGYARYMLVETKKDLQDTIQLYEKNLEKNKESSPVPSGTAFIEYFVE